MLERLRERKQSLERWVWPAALLLAAVVLVIITGLWLWRCRAYGQNPLTGAPVLIVTATATQAAHQGNGEIIQPMHPQENWPLPGSSSNTEPLDFSRPYAPQLGSPKYLPAFAHEEKGCGWFGVGGQVFDETGAPRDGLIVSLTGMLDGRSINLLGVTAPLNVFGPGGYEIFVTDHLPEQGSVVEAQLFNVNGEALSDPVTVALPVDCEKNLVLVNFQAGASVANTYIPLVQNLP